MKSRMLAVIATVFGASVAFAGAPVPLYSPPTATPNSIVTYGTQPNQAASGNASIGTSGNAVCPANANCTTSGNNTHNGSENYTGTFQKNGVTQTFPASGSLLGTTDAQSPTNKSIDANANTIINLRTSNFASGVLNTDPTLSGANDTSVPSALAAKTYTDNASQGLLYKSPAQLATTTNITLSGEQTIDGVLTSTSRVLVKNQISLTQNGIYTSGSGAWTRTNDANTGLLLKSATLLVSAGTVNANSTWNCACANVTIGVDPILFVQISGSNTYSAGTGLQLSAGQFSVDSTIARGTINGVLAGNGAGVVSQGTCGGLSNAGTACARDVGTIIGTVAAGNDSRIVGAAQVAGDNIFSGTNTHSGSESFDYIAQAPNIFWDRVVPTVTTTIPCGTAISTENNVGTLTIKLPAAPQPGCRVVIFANARTNSALIDPNGKYIKSNDFDKEGTPLLIPYTNGHYNFSMEYMPGTDSWHFQDAVPPPSSIYRYNLHHGGVRFDHDPVLPRTRLCPSGDGGIIINRMLYYVASTCVFLPDSALSTPSHFYDVYVSREQNVRVQGAGTGAPCPDAGKMCLTFINHDIPDFYSGNAITCVNFTTTPLANVIDDPNTIVVDSTHIELSDVTYLGPEPAFGELNEPICAFNTLLATSGNPQLDPWTGVLVGNANTEITLVGAIYTDDAGAVVDSPCERNVTSYYNRAPKKFQCVLATTTTVPFAAGNNYHTPVAPFQGKFISFGPPYPGGNPNVPWTTTMRGQVSGGSIGTTVGLATLFGQASKSGSVVCPAGSVEAPDRQTANIALNVNVDFQESGVTSVPIEQSENYVNLCAFTTSGTLNVEGTDNTGSPGGTTISAMLWQ